MDDPMERAAKALYDHWRLVEDWSNEYVEWEILPNKQTWLDRARVIIEAIREPSAEMLAETGYDKGMNETPLRDWQAMIDTLLQESEG